MSNPFWEFSLATYRVEGVAETCLRLQDTWGVDVNLLLYSAWLSHLNLRLDERHLRDLDSLVDDWRKQVVRPLRSLRRELAGYDQAQGVRQELKALELRTEREQQERMYAFHQRSDRLHHARAPLRDNLALVVQQVSQDEQAWMSDIAHLVSLIPP